MQKTLDAQRAQHASYKAARKEEVNKLESDLSTLRKSNTDEMKHRLKQQRTQHAAFTAAKQKELSKLRNELEITRSKNHKLQRHSTPISVESVISGLHFEKVHEYLVIGHDLLPINTSRMELRY